MEHKTVKAGAHPWEGTSMSQEQMLPGSQELCALIYELTLPPMNIEIPQAKSSIPEFILPHNIGYKEIEKCHLTASIAVLPSWSLLRIWKNGKR